MLHGLPNRQLTVPAILRNVASTACRSRYIITPSQRKKAGLPGSNPASTSRASQSSVSKSAATNVTRVESTPNVFKVLQETFDLKLSGPSAAVDLAMAIGN